MFILNEFKFYLNKIKSKISKLIDEKDLTKLLENYKNDNDIAKIEEYMKEANYKIAGMSSVKDRSLFRNLYDVDYKHLLDDAPYYTMGIFIVPKGVMMPIHDHRNMLVFTKLLCGKAEIISYDKSVDLDLDENEFEVKLTEKKVYNEGDLTILTPLNKNIHQIIGLEDTAFLDVIIPDYTDDNMCNYYKLRTVNNQHYLKRFKYL